MDPIIDRLREKWPQREGKFRRLLETDDFDKIDEAWPEISEMAQAMVDEIDHEFEDTPIIDLVDAAEEYLT